MKISTLKKDTPKYSKSHFKVTESGHPSARMDRGDLESLVGVKCGENASRVPLLYSMLSAVRKKKKS